MKNKYDIVIIGSGIAAAALSQRLLKNNPKASILILEAGQSVKMQDSAIWQDLLVSGKLPYTKYQDLPYPTRNTPGQNRSAGRDVLPVDGSRVMTFGGTTIHWAGWSFRLKPEDFKLYTNTGHGIDWPIDYDDLEHYYGEAEEYIGVSGSPVGQNTPRKKGYPFPPFPFTLEDEPVIQAFRKLKIEYSNVPMARHGSTQTDSPHAPCKTTGTCDYCPFGARYSANNFLNEMMEWNRYPNFEVRLNSVVQEIMMKSKTEAKGVKFFDKVENKMREVSAKHIVVAGGTIESPKLLQRSKSKFAPNGIGNDNDLVGRYLLIQPWTTFTGVVKANPKKMQTVMAFPTLCTRHFDSKKEQDKGKFILANWPPATLPTTLSTMMQNGDSSRDIKKAISENYTVTINGQSEIFSEHRNRVYNLESKVNQIGLYETVVDFTKPAGFDHRLEEIKEHVQKVFLEMGAKMDPHFSTSIRADHASCTCRMAKSPKEGVVDKDLKVFGTENVYVCSNAAFSSMGAVNPTLTLAALSIRLGDHLSKSQKG